MAEEFASNGVNVVPMDDASFQQWVARSKPIWDSFASDVPGGDELIRLAREASGR